MTTSAEVEHDRRIRVYLLDDHEIVRRGIKELLESEGDVEVVGESGLAQEAARRIPALRPDVAILDGRLPDGSGVDVCREVRSRDPGISVLILTSYDDDDALFAAIMAGAMMLEFLGEESGAARIEGAVTQLLQTGKIPSLDAKSGLSTSQVGDMVAKAVS